MTSKEAIKSEDKKLKAPSPYQLAWLLPATILIHQLEEYFGQFPIWYSELLNAQLSDQDFIMINAVGLLVISAFALSYFLNNNNLILVALGTLVFVNGLTHMLLSIFTISYSPGTVSGVVLFIPLGIVIFKKIMPLLGMVERIIAIVTGTFVLILVSTIARNI